MLFQIVRKYVYHNLVEINNVSFYLSKRITIITAARKNPVNPTISVILSQYAWTLCIA